MRELQPGLWHWQAPHPDWTPDERWPREVSSYAIDDGSRLLLIDPLAVPDELLDWQQRVCRTPMSDEHVKTYREELSRLGEKTLAQGPRRANWGRRLWHRIQNMF